MDDTIRLRYLDALRGLAVIMIVLMHAWSGRIFRFPAIADDILGCGYVGVHMLFVVTGLSLALRWTKDSLVTPGGLRAYAIRRACRIIPPWYLGVLLYMGILGWGPRVFAPHGVDGFDVALTMSFLHNWRWNSINSVVTGGWSIGAVVTFYIFFPPLLHLAGKRRVFWALVVLGTVAIQLLNVYTQAHHLNEAFAWSFPGTGVIFLFGMAAARYIPHTVAGGTEGVGVAAGRLLGIGVAAFLIGGLPFWHLPEWLMTYRLQVGMITAALCVILSGYPALPVVNRLLASVGRLTFSVLILHPLVMSPAGRLTLWLAGQLDLAPSGALTGVVFLVSVVIGSVAVGAVGFAIVELPAIRLGRRLTPQAKLPPLTAPGFP